jgi:hypothetical protein
MLVKLQNTMQYSIADVFISSTNEDLKEYRKKASEIILHFRCTPIQMEYFGALPELPIDVCQEMVEKSDLLILIVSNRFGWVPPKKLKGDGKKSITWLEYDWAEKAGKDIYVFLLNPNGKLLKDEHSETKTASRRLLGFQQYLKKYKTVQYINSPDELASYVGVSIFHWLLKKLGFEGLSESLSRNEENDIQRARLLADIQRNLEQIDGILLNMLNAIESDFEQKDDEPWQVTVLKRVTDNKVQSEKLIKNYVIYHTLLYEQSLITKAPLAILEKIKLVGTDIYFELDSLSGLSQV